jgi:uncharacterized cupredoxin-like copper-binding protein
MPRPRRLVALIGFCLLAIAFGPGLAAAAQVVHVDLMEASGGRMVLKPSVTTVKAGKVTFMVTNKSQGTKHEFLVAPLRTTLAKVPYDNAKGRVKEAALKGLKELGDLEPGKSGSMTMDLKPGTYLLFCNIPGHFKLGMRAVLTVTR